MVCGSGFVIFALAWYFTWAIYIHSNMSMYGGGPASMELKIPVDEERRMRVAQVWVRWFRWATWLFLGLTLAAALLWGGGN